jgi:hypothetical protein
LGGQNVRDGAMVLAALVVLIVSILGLILLLRKIKPKVKRHKQEFMTL